MNIRGQQPITISISECVVEHLACLLAPTEIPQHIYGGLVPAGLSIWSGAPDSKCSLAPTPIIERWVIGRSRLGHFTRILQPQPQPQPYPLQHG
jgi:hypothetical protein